MKNFLRLTQVTAAVLLTLHLNAEEPAKTIEESGLFDKFAKPCEDCSLALRERAEIDGDGNGAGPARFAVVAPRSGDATFKFDGALVFNRAFSPNDDFKVELLGWQTSADIHLSSDATQDERSVAFRSGFTGIWHAWDGGGFYGEVNGLFEADQDFTTQSFSPDLRFTIVETRMPGLGEEEKLIPGFLNFEWRPWLGMDGVFPTEVPFGAPDDFTLRLFLLARLDLTFVKAPWLSVSTQYKGYLLLGDGPNDGKTHGYVQASVNLKVNKNVSIEGGYKNGELAPNFGRHLDLFFAGLGVQF